MMTLEWPLYSACECVIQEPVGVNSYYEFIDFSFRYAFRIVGLFAYQFMLFIYQ